MSTHPTLARLTRLPHFLRLTARFTFWIAASAITFNDHILEHINVSGESMAPTLSPTYNTTGAKTHLLINKWEPTRDLQRGDVVHFTNPLRPDAALAIKRVVALEGDTVLLDPRRRPWAKDGRDMPEARAWDRYEGRMVVPKGHVWVEGDNWRWTVDSNTYGPMSRQLVLGRAVCAVWPLGEFGKRPWEEWMGGTRVIEGKSFGNAEGEGWEGLVAGMA